MASARIEEIDREIDALKQELSSVRGTETEVYTRIVGYYRSVKNWNKGKREEYGERELFSVIKASRAVAEEEAAADAKVREDAPSNANAVAPAEKADPKAYVLFLRDLCPNCPPVKAYVSELGIDGVHVDVDTEEGLSAARKYGVMASPTVIFFDDDKRELFRAHSLGDLRKRMERGVSA